MATIDIEGDGMTIELKMSTNSLWGVVREVANLLDVLDSLCKEQAEGIIHLELIRKGGE